MTLQRIYLIVGGLIGALAGSALVLMMSAKP